MALRLLRILPLSLAESPLLKRGGRAKSRAVKVPDFRRACLSKENELGWLLGVITGLGMTYGLGITARSWNDDTSGVEAGSVGEYGSMPPRGLAGRPACRSLYEVGGAKSNGMANESSRNI